MDVRAYRIFWNIDLYYWRAYNRGDVMRHGSLFSGIGGPDLAAEWMGWKNIFHCEINPFGRSVLNYYWPDAASYDDITKTDFTIHRGNIDILTGGFPCQPYSLAGSRKGKEDDRHLWPHMLRAIREIQPTWIVGENVRGIVSWNNGMVFEEVQAEMENEGYEVQSFEIPSCGIGADHVRERVWFCAYSCSVGRENVQSHIGGRTNKIKHPKGDWKSSAQWDKETNELDSSCNTFLRFQEMYSEPPVFDVADGLPFELDGITVPKWIEESHKAAGNAIDPRIIFEIFKAIDRL